MQNCTYYGLSETSLLKDIPSYQMEHHLLTQLQRVQSYKTTFEQRHPLLE